MPNYSFKENTIYKIDIVTLLSEASINSKLLSDGVTAREPWL